ncbi:MAG: ATP-binding cassette domain-containing protein [Spirochaeta sp.]|jgi:ABC-type lipoprotein export system ATPase subunit|nr:ATP-binding cassette domain-containing protein [Spirochaeta sp.]
MTDTKHAAMDDTATALAALIGDDDGETDGTAPDGPAVRSLTLLPGTDKSGTPENYTELTFCAGDIVCVVGPTGSGKSRLLADIEWLARYDTPTGRGVLINGTEPDLSGRYAGTGRLVAQLSQNMNFVMDATVGEFLDLHGESRGITITAADQERIVTAANALTGEPIAADRQLTELSGGQSRALMIADTALLSTSPIVLIDEIENAGIDRHAAIALLRGADKIVLIATHDPSLALSAERRLVIANGGISEVRERSAGEQQLAERLRKLDRLQEELRRAIRGGEGLDGFAADPRLP